MGRRVHQTANLGQVNESNCNSCLWIVFLKFCTLEPWCCQVRAFVYFMHIKLAAILATEL